MTRRLSIPSPTLLHIMKHSTKAKYPKGKAQASPPPAGGAARFSWPRWGILGLCVVLAAAGTWAVFEFIVWNKLPGDLVGRWVVVEGPQEGSIFDFHRNGTLVGKVQEGEWTGPLQATLRLEGKKIHSTTRQPRTGQKDTFVEFVQTIRTLTEKELVLEDERGPVVKMARAEPVPPELVGKWVVVDGPQEGAVFDFFRNGTMVGKVNERGLTGIVNATVFLVGKKLYATTKHPQTGQEGTRVQLIRKLTATELVVEDERGQRLKMERAE